MNRKKFTKVDPITLGIFNFSSHHPSLPQPSQPPRTVATCPRCQKRFELLPNSDTTLFSRYREREEIISPSGQREITFSLYSDRECPTRNCTWYERNIRWGMEEEILTGYGVPEERLDYLYSLYEDGLQRGRNAQNCLREIN